MGFARGFILSQDERNELRTKEAPTPHCYFCGSPYVCAIKGEDGPVKVSCLICNKTFFVDHDYGGAL